MYKRFERANESPHSLSHGLTLKQYYSWLNKAEQARDKYLADKISAEEALRIITAE